MDVHMGEHTKKTDIYIVKRVKKPIDWIVEVPGSKSMTNRALLMGALADGRTTLNGVLFSDDSRYFLGALESLGFRLEADEKNKCVTIEGLGGRLPSESGEINVGSAGTAARFLTAMLALAKGSFTIQASEQMQRRPMKPLFDAVTALGAEITYLGKEGFLPIKIKGIGGKLELLRTEGCGNAMLEVELDISRSTQFLSALMLVSPMAYGGIRVKITSEKKDGSYIRVTRSMMEQFGAIAEFDGNSYIMRRGIAYSPGTYQIEPDVSAACYFYAAAAVTGGSALVRNVTWECMQGDMKFISLLEKMGCQARQLTIPEKNLVGIQVTGPSDEKLKGITVDMNDFSDQTMTLAAIAPYASDKVRIENIAHIRLQESDRLSAISAALFAAGIRFEEEEGAITIYPGAPGPCVIDTCDDHRMAMAFTVMGLGADGIVISNPMCCKKTFENYFEIIDALLDE